MGKVEGQPSEKSIDVGADRGPTVDGAERTLTKNDVFDILKNERRRAVVRYLLEHDGSADLSDVAEHVAARENGTDVRRLSSQERKRVRIALYQCHLPRMDAARVIEFDKDRGGIELRDVASQLQVYLDVEAQNGRNPGSSSRFAFALAVGVAALVVAGTLGFGPLSAVPPVGWVAVSSLTLVAIAGHQWRFN